MNSVLMSASGALLALLAVTQPGFHDPVGAGAPGLVAAGVPGPRQGEAAEAAGPSEDAPAMREQEARRPEGDSELAFWLQNMEWHAYTPAEMAAATGLSQEEVGRAMDRLGIRRGPPPVRKPGDTLRVLPYPGGRHPRIGFLDGAVNPQRETKVSIFTPWDPAAYVVVDVPEAVFSNLGLLYLAHTHVPTLWDQKGIRLERHEWRRHGDNSLTAERRLPNGVRFGSRIVPGARSVEMELWLENGTDSRLTDLRVQVCVMLKGVPGFTAQTNENKVLSSPVAAARSEDGRRWIVTAWEPVQRVWANPPVPCIHSDPRFPDCDPGQTVRVRGRLWFHEGPEPSRALTPP